MNSRYSLLSKLSTSLYGEIYLAKDKYAGNQVVVKLSSAPKKQNCTENPALEIELLEKLRETKKHDGQQHIIKLVEAFPVTVDGDDLTCMVMEYAPGGDLLDKIISCEERKKKMSFSKIRKYSLMMAKGVAFLHSQGIVHMDLSLENMLLTGQDEIRICDFGQAQEQQLFRAFSPRRGKLAYMAPEVFKYHAFDGFKADVWSLGVILWSMLANGSLYEKPVSADPHFAFVTQGKEGLQKLFEGSDVLDIPAQCLDLLSHMLAISPTSRYTMDQVLAHPWFSEKSKKKKLAVSSSKKGSFDVTSSPEEPSSLVSDRGRPSIPTSASLSPPGSVASSPRCLVVRLSSDSSNSISPLSPLSSVSPLSSPCTSGTTTPIEGSFLSLRGLSLHSTDRSPLNSSDRSPLNIERSPRVDMF